MIQYNTRTAVIKRLVSIRQPDWATKAAQRTDEHETAGRYIKKDEILADGTKAKDFWGDVKSVFITVQCGKCAYCEAKPESSAIQWDVEHFRPKSDVDEWELPGPGNPEYLRRHFHRKPGSARWEYHIPTGPAMTKGYYLLAYDLENYAICCKTCNTIYKRAYFPVQNARVSIGKSVVDYKLEGAYLIYPLGDQREDPEQDIAFDDVQAVAKNGSVRGQLIIDFFDLNREGLQRSRAEWLVHTVYNVYEGFSQGRQKAIKTMEWLLSYKAPFTNCTRCFVNLCLNDSGEAERRYSKMEKILLKSPRI